MEVIHLQYVTAVLSVVALLMMFAWVVFLLRARKLPPNILQIDFKGTPLLMKTIEAAKYELVIAVIDRVRGLSEAELFLNSAGLSYTYLRDTPIVEPLGNVVFVDRKTYEKHGFFGEAQIHVFYPVKTNELSRYLELAPKCSKLLLTTDL